MDIKSKAIANNKEVILLTKEQQISFVESLLNPELPNAKLQKSMKKYLEMENKKGYESYKSSGVDWIGDIPEHWEVRKVKYLFAIGRGRVISQQELKDDGVYPVYSSQTSNNGCLGYINTFDFEGKYLTWTTDGANAGTIFLRNGKFNCTNVCGTLKNRTNNNINFILYVLQFSALNNKRPDTNGSKIMNNEMAGLEVTLPPNIEQQKIASYLDKKSEAIDQFIKNKENLIKLLDEEKKTLITQAVTKGINPDVSYKNSGVEWIGDIPEHWEVIKLKFSTTIFRGKFTHRPRNDPALYDGEYPFIQTGDVAKAGKFLFKYKQTLNKRGLNVSTIFPKGTIVITIAANIGDISILDINACFPDSIVGFNPNKFLERDFLYYVLISMKQQFIESTIENTQMNLNIDRIGKNSITLLPILEQQQIITYIEEKTQKIDDLKAKYKQEIDLIKEYKERLIYDVVTGKINVLEY